MSKPNYRSTLYACYLGYITQAAVVNLSPILFIIYQNAFGLSFEKLGRLILINFVTQLLTDLMAVRYINRIGLRRAAIIGHLCAVAGFIMMSTLPRILPSPYTGLVISAVVYAIGGGLIEVLVSPTVDALPGEAKDAAMSLLHSFYSWGQVAVMLLSTLFIRVFGAENWYWLPLLWGIVPAFNAWLFSRVPLAPMPDEDEQTPLRTLLVRPLFLLAMLMMICSGAAEQAVAQWSSLFAEVALGIPKLLGDVLGPVMFAVCMAIGRTAYGIWGERLNLRRTLLFSAALCIACYAMIVFTHSPALSLIGVAVSGLAVCIMWPGMLRVASSTYPLGGTPMFGVLAIMGDVGCALGPWLTGLVSDSAQSLAVTLAWAMGAGWDAEQIGLRIGLLSAVIFPVVMLVGLMFWRRGKAKPAAESNI